MAPLSCARSTALLLCGLAASCKRAGDEDDRLAQRASTVSATAPTGTAPATPPPAASVTASPRREQFDGTAGVIEVRRETRHPATLRDVRAARHDGFDRLVLEFKDRVPGYHIEYIDRPVRQCGSGEATPIEGDGWLEVRMSPAYAHDEGGKPTVPPRERALDLGVMRELELTCDFEAVVTWVVGVAIPNRYRVLELENPPRLVVDVRH